MSKKKPPSFIGEPGPLLHTARWRLGEFELDEGKRELSRQGLVIPLEPKPLNMLMLLVRHPGELITKNDLMEALWTGRIVTETVLSNSVAKLRNALGDEDCRLIRTVHGYGYRLEAHPELITETPQIQVPEVAFEADSPVPLRPNWRLRRRLGRSGEVWLAEQPMTGELRVFKFAYTPKALSALKREVTLYRLLRQTLEDRAPILDLLDWNFDEPPWFIETEFCELGSLQEYLDHQGGAASLPMDKRLGIVIQIAEALASVHSLGILHKDLKPANVLISPARDGEIRIRLADFGSGRLLDYAQLEHLAITRLGFTQFADPSGSSTSGTPLYYAPEVLSGQPVTLKADVYALGVILYQLVVGDMRRLFAPGWEAGVVDELIREDIGACAAGNPSLRLSDAGQLSLRLRQLPARRSERAQQLAQREAAAQTVLALQKAEARRAGYRLVAVALGLGLIVSLGMYWQALQAREKARLATHQAETARDFVLTDVLGKLSAGIESPGRTTVSELLLEAGRLVGPRFQSEPALDARIRHQLGDALQQLGLRDEASIQFKAALERSQSLQTEDPQAFVELVTSHFINEMNRGHFEEQAGTFMKLHSLSKTLVSADDPVLLGQYRVLTMAAEGSGRFIEAETQISSSLPLAKALSDREPRKYVSVLRILGRIQLGNGNYPAALETLRQALTGAERHVGSKHLLTANILCLIAQAQALSGNYDSAESALIRAESIAKDWEPSVGELTLTVLGNQGYLALERRDFLKAADVLTLFESGLARSTEELRARSTYDEYLRARLALETKHWSEALTHADIAIKRGQSSNGETRLGILFPELQQIAARALIQMNKLPEAGDRLHILDSKMLTQLPKQHFIQAEQFYLKYKLAAAVDPSANHNDLLHQAITVCNLSLTARNWRCRAYQPS